MFGITGRHIRKGEQLYVTYLNSNDLSKRNVRRQKLFDHWGYNCECERCENLPEIDAALIDQQKQSFLTLYTLEEELNKPEVNWNTQRGAQMMVYDERLRGYSPSNFLKV